MTKVFPPAKTESDKQSMNGGMTAMAAKEVRFHTQPLPEAEVPSQAPFPRPVLRGLWAGIGIGAILGLLMGVLLFQNILVIPGSEALYSMGPFTFHVFWLVMGAAAGMVLIGVAAILQTPTEHPKENE